MAEALAQPGSQRDLGAIASWGIVAAEARAIPGSVILTSDPDGPRALLADQPSIKGQAVCGYRLEPNRVPGAAGQRRVHRIHPASTCQRGDSGTPEG